MVHMMTTAMLHLVVQLTTIMSVQVQEHPSPLDTVQMHQEPATPLLLIVQRVELTTQAVTVRMISGALITME